MLSVYICSYMQKLDLNIQKRIIYICSLIQYILGQFHFQKSFIYLGEEKENKKRKKEKKRRGIKGRGEEERNRGEEEKIEKNRIFFYFLSFTSIPLFFSSFSSSFSSSIFSSIPFFFSSFYFFFVFLCFIGSVVVDIPLPITSTRGGGRYTPSR